MPTGRPGHARAFHPQWLVVAAAVLWNYWWLRSETVTVATLDDSSVHEQMVRFAAARLRAGHLPQTSWFPYLGLGSPQFLHYQSLPSTVTGAVGIVVGPDRAFADALATGLLASGGKALARIAGLRGYSALIVEHDGTVQGTLPTGITTADLDTPALLRGEQTAGTTGHLAHWLSPAIVPMCKTAKLPDRPCTDPEIRSTAT